MRKSIVIGFLFISAVACKKKSESINMHLDYFGNQQGKFVIYKAKEITHLSPDSSVVLNYELKTLIGDTVHDNAGNIGNKYFRFVRENASESWSLKDVWFIDITNYQAILIEENEKKIKMVFAPLESKTWDINAYNNLGEQICTYEDLHQPFSIGGYMLDSTIKVVEDDQFNLISLRKKHEIYAKGIGLIKKHYQHLNINNFDVNNVNSGKELFLNMIAYGQE